MLYLTVFMVLCIYLGLILWTRHVTLCIQEWLWLRSYCRSLDIPVKLFESRESMAQRTHRLICTIHPPPYAAKVLRERR